MRYLVSFICWRLPIKILKSGITFLNLEGAGQRSGRRRPLQTCGASILAIAQKACTNLPNIDGPLGSMTNSVASFMKHFLPFFSCPFIAIISYLDDHILSFETKVETILPPSTRLFDKIDALIGRSEALPEAVDNVLKISHPSIMEHLPFLGWVIKWLNPLLSGGSHNTREKEITIDVPSKPFSSNVMDLEEVVKSYHANDLPNCEVSVNNRNDTTDSPMCNAYHSANSSPTFDCSEGESDNNMSCTYKEMLERGHKQVHQSKDQRAEMIGKQSNEGDPKSF